MKERKYVHKCTWRIAAVEVAAVEVATVEVVVAEVVAVHCYRQITYNISFSSCSFAAGE